MAEVKKVWNASGTSLYLSPPTQEFEKLENAIYTVNIDEYGRFFLTKKSDGFSFDYKIYGLETDLISRILKTYASSNGNLGVLLNGLKGTGKTVSSKIIASKLNQPIILVDNHFKGIHVFLNSIPQNITILIDEYEKIFGDSSAMLTIMDGALNSTFRRVFLLTTNDLYVEKNLLQRPGRIRYLKKFEDLSPLIINEIVDDILVNKEMKSQCIQFISNLENITVDIVKAVVNEMNIHDEVPSEFESVFNVKKLKGLYNVMLRDENGEMVEIASSVSIYPRPMYNEGSVNDTFEVNGKYIGKITRIINFTTIEITPDIKSEDEVLRKPFLVKIDDADAINYSYMYDSYGGSKIKEKKKVSTEFIDNINNRINEGNKRKTEFLRNKIQDNTAFQNSLSVGLPISKNG